VRASLEQDLVGRDTAATDMAGAACRWIVAVPFLAGSA
jgi:hypothetical protein